MGYWYFTSPKYKSYRVIDIDDVLVSILKEEYEKQKRDEEYYGEFYKMYYSEFQLLYSVQKNKEKEIPLNEVSTKETDFGVDFVCRREDGSYVTSRTLQNVSNAVHKELDIPGYDTYSLRHTHGTMLIENGADMVYVQRRLGHKNINVTMKIYTNHLTPIIKSRNNITLNNMY